MLINNSIVKRKGLFLFIVAWLFSSILIFSSCSPQLTVAEAELKYGTHAPVIEHFYFPPTIRSGDTLKVYISARDEDGDLAYVHIDLRQMGVGEKSIPFIAVPEKNRSLMSGYFYMFTPSAVLFGETINISVKVIDKAGHRSNAVSQDVYFGNKPSTGYPPEWAEDCDNDLGFVPIFLRPLKNQRAIRSFGTP